MPAWLALLAFIGFTAVAIGAYVAAGRS